MVEKLSTLPASDFPKYYLGILEVSQGAAARNMNPFATVRPNPPEILGLQTPAQVRFWKRWSAKIQGTVALKTRVLYGPKGDMQFMLIPSK